MARIIIEGSNNPSTFLAKGQRTIVERSPMIDKLIRKGFVVVIDERPSTPAAPSAAPPEPAVDEPEEIEVPPESAIKSVWQDFLDDMQIAYPATATKADLIARWEAAQHTEQVYDDAMNSDA